MSRLLSVWPPASMLGVEPGPDQVPGPGLVAVRQRDHGLPVEPAALDQPLAGHPRQRGGFLVRPGQQQGVLAAQVVGEPEVDRLVAHPVGGAVVDPPVAVVLAERQDVALAQPQRGGPLPGLGEPADLGYLPVPVLAGQQAEDAAGLDRAELLGVADRLGPGPGLVQDLPDAQQVGGGELAGLIEDQDVVRRTPARARGSRPSP